MRDGGIWGDLGGDLIRFLEMELAISWFDFGLWVVGKSFFAVSKNL